MSKLTEMVQDYQIPKVCKVRQLFDSTRLEDVEGKMSALWKAGGISIKPGARIAITGGSRGIAGYQRVMKHAVQLVKDAGGIPFIVPAMGSHGGGTAQGQEKMLENLGITEKTVGAPVVSSMDVVEVTKTELGLPVYIDKNAVEADGIILLNRVKTHTSIREEFQSGLLKMMAIGLAKHKGAAMTHSLGTPNLGENMVRVGKAAIGALKITAGIALIENGYEELADVYVLRQDQILEEEPKILQRAVSMIPMICTPAIDALIVRELGKDVSGTGMDPAVVGRPINRKPNEGPQVEALGVLRVTKRSDGNASGTGMADFISRKLRAAINEEYTCVNSLTGMKPVVAAIPITLETDRLVVQGCIKASGQIVNEKVKLVLIKNTKSLDEIYLSETALKSVRELIRKNEFFPEKFPVNDGGNGMPARKTCGLQGPVGIEICSDFEEVPFDGEGNLLLWED